MAFARLSLIASAERNLLTAKLGNENTVAAQA